jgi:DNA polymerase-1
MTLKQRLGLDEEPLYLIDGTAYFYRGFYAFPDLKRSDGFPTNALFIVLRILLKLLREEEPRYVGFFMDGKGPTFRSGLYPEYKANRPAAPEPLIQQVEPLKRAVSLLGLLEETAQDVEADDAIASMADRFKAERPVVILGPDKDLKQCLDKGVYIWDPGAKNEKLIDLQAFEEETGLQPDNWPDYQALIGDSSDNIPGVPGVGPKTALKVMRDFPTLEAIRDNLDQLPKAAKKKIEPHIEDAFIYRKLTRLRTDWRREHRLEDFERKPLDPGPLAEFLSEFEFRSLAREFKAMAGQSTAAPAAKTERRNASGQRQASLFAEPQADVPAPEVKSVADTEALPALEERVVGLVPRDQGLHLGVDGEELFWAGRPEALISALASARLVAAPDLKELLHLAPAVRDLPLEKFFDLGLAAYLLSPEERHYSLDRLVMALDSDPEADPPPRERPGLGARAVYDALLRRLRDAGLLELMRDLETPLTLVLADMERAGVHIDQEAFAEYLQEVSGELDRLTRAIYDQAGETFNIRSSQQLGAVLFDKLGLKPAGKTAGGALSTSVDALEKLHGAHPVIELILEYRRLEKLRSTYLAPFPKLAGKDGRIHTTFNQTATATGRLSSSNPNLQNIPIRGPHGKRMRACFTAAPGNLLVAADYSQIELRVLAHFSRDPALLAAFGNDEDIHSATAALLFDVASGDVEPDMRRQAKTINFGLIYGMGPQKLARELSIPLKEAKEFTERYFEKLATLKSFYDRLIHEAESNGYVTTWAGRRRLLPELSSRNQNLAAQARRQAVNTVIQGSAADIIKLAMLKVSADPELAGLSARLVLQVHDELVAEAPAENAKQAKDLLVAHMSQVADLRVPLKVDAGVGENWGEAH